jgi:hypothetical protein
MTDSKAQTVESSETQKTFHFVYTKTLMILLLVFIPFSIGYFIGNKFILPLLTAIPAGLVLIRHIKNGRITIAVLDMIVYVLWLSVIGIALMYFFPAKAASVVMNGDKYLAEMYPWLCGAMSKEGTPAQFIPEHLLHMAIVAVASLISAGVISLIFGTILMNYMNYYVSWLMLNSSQPLLMAVIGWHPWSICRVISFIILGCVCAVPILKGLRGHEKSDYRKYIIMIVAAIAFEVLDIVLKTYIGSGWRDLLVMNLESGVFEMQQ